MEHPAQPAPTGTEVDSTDRVNLITLDPLPDTALRKTLSWPHSTPWSPRSPKLRIVTEYGQSVYKFPWLAGGGSNDTASYEDLKEGGHSRLRWSNSHWRDSSRIVEVLEGEESESSSTTKVTTSDTPQKPLDDVNIVTWDGPNDPMNPKNWPKSKKWTATVLVSFFAFISPFASTMLAPALPTLEKEFNITSATESYLLMSIFLLAYAVGPFILGPLSEIYGRVIVFQSANMVFLLFNTVCEWSTSKQQMLAFRFLGGIGASAPQALGGGVLSDCWRAEERGRASAAYSLAPFLGPAIGPIAAGYMTQYLNWRWIFWTVSIADALVQILCFFLLHETYAPKILLAKAKRLRRDTDNPKLHTEYETPDRTFSQTLRKNLARPFIMLFTQPALQITALYRAYLYGLMYLVLASFPMVFVQQYHQDTGRASLNYISLGVGFVIGLQISGPMIDKARYNHPGRPEFRIPLMYPTAVVVLTGLLMYGIAAHFRAHWILPNIGAAIFAAGLMLSFQCVQTYTIDTYERYAASATGAAAFLRTMAGFSFPLSAPGLYGELGIMVGNGVLGGVAFVLGMIVPMLMWKYGAWLRSKKGQNEVF
ncbi:related to multidrug resistant protein [Cephalotrichum gorgonifer]|uniref:Related to multidrug resistant protein n=1 Tax=Cephalotrichum gorgonifer TaxID=2041049 RepID=A0AAE8SXM6_9PEZI|nr:related to multidrug resistant protein [Cephalotrichum gorgonifer]